MRGFVVTLVTLVTLGLLLVDVMAAAKPRETSHSELRRSRVDPAGTWTWSFTAPNGRKGERSATFARKGQIVTGTTDGDGGPAPVQEGKFTAGKLSFLITRDSATGRTRWRFAGTVTAEAIEGTMTVERAGTEQQLPWTARRHKGPKPPAGSAETGGHDHVHDHVHDHHRH